MASKDPEVFPFRGQVFSSLRADCQRSGSLFTDPLFPADQSSIGMPVEGDPNTPIKWLRPKEVSKNAVFIEDTTSSTDICQGQLGNCWLLAALSSLTLHPTLFSKVVPAEQSLSEGYAGIFRFRFWQYGDWVEVVVDDLLPVRSGRLLFSHSRSLNEFWSALVEKAYAKMMGSYGSLKGGNISEGMEDFTGGIARSLSVSSRPPLVLWKALSASLSRGTLLSCFIQATNVKEIGTMTKEGLVKGHAYAITDTDKVHKKTGEEVCILKLRNPWGFVEYCGPWSDKCKDWDEVDSAEQKRIKLTKAEDGEFWMGVEDFCSLYNTVELCSVSPDSLPEEETQDTQSSSWTITFYQGSWVSGCSAGGSLKFPRSYWKNPQFRLTLSEQDDYEDEDEEPGNGDKAGGEAAKKPPVSSKPKEKVMKCTMVAEVLQKNRRQKDKTNFLPIAFHVYKIPPALENTSSILDQKFFTSAQPVALSGSYQSVRGVRRKVRLNPGQYVVLVSTSQPNQQGDFYLRIFAKSGNTLGDADFTCSTLTPKMVQSKPIAPEKYQRVEELFSKEGGTDERLDALELMKVLNMVLEDKYQLPLETCRQLIFGEDTGGRCRLTHPQTVQLMASLRVLQSVFIRYDEDSSGTMNAFDLSLALKAAGFRVEGAVLTLLWERVSAGELELPFHGFVSCVTKLRVLFALYESESSPEVKERGINSWLMTFLAV